MTQEEILKAKLPDLTDIEIEMLLDSAKSIILNKRFPFKDFPISETGETYIEDRYKTLQIEIALELDAKDGANGENAHTENGLQRVYESGNISPSLLNRITPKGGVL